MQNASVPCKRSQAEMDAVMCDDNKCACPFKLYPACFKTEYFGPDSHLRKPFAITLVM